MDDRSLSAIRFDTIRRWVAEYAASDLGHERLVAMTPTTVPETVARMLALTDEARMAREFGAGIPLNGLQDIRTMVSRAEAGGRLAAGDCLAVADTLDAMTAARRFLLKLPNEPYPLLTAMADQMVDMAALWRAIMDVIGDDACVRETASPEMTRISGRLKMIRRRIEQHLSDMCRAPRIRSMLAIPKPTLAGERLVLAVKVEFKRRIRGTIHRVSDSGKTVFIEPEQIIQLGHDISGLKADEARESARLLMILSRKIGQHAGDIHAGLAVMAELDAVRAKAELGARMGWRTASIADGRRMRLVNARHPILEKIDAESGTEKTDDSPGVVPFSLSMGDDHDILLVTGPNTGGKTVLLKSVGLLAVMTQCGLPIPADAGSRLPVYDAVFADIGDEQSIEQSLSTFSGHIRNIRYVLDNATDHSLALLDELGAGTDPIEGAALSLALLQRLLSIGCTALVTTHIGELKLFPLRHARCENASMMFDSGTLKPTYQLVVGRPGESCALNVAERLGLQADVINSAKSLMTPDHPDIIKLADEIREIRDSARILRDRAADEHARAEAIRRDAEAFRDRLTRRLADAGQHPKLDLLTPGTVVLFEGRRATVRRVDPEKHTAILRVGSMDMTVNIDRITLELPPEQTAESIQTRTPDAIREEIRQLRHQRRELEALKRKQELILRELDAQRSGLPSLAKDAIRPGDTVRVKTLDKTLPVDDVHPETQTLTVRLGVMRMEVNLSDVERVDTPPVPVRPLSGHAENPACQPAPVRGSDTGEADTSGSNDDDPVEDVSDDALFLDDSGRGRRGSKSGAKRRGLTKSQRAKNREIRDKRKKNKPSGQTGRAPKKTPGSKKASGSHVGGTTSGKIKNTFSGKSDKRAADKPPGDKVNRSTNNKSKHDALQSARKRADAVLDTLPVQAGQRQDDTPASIQNAIRRAEAVQAGHERDIARKSSDPVPVSDLPPPPGSGDDGAFSPGDKVHVDTFQRDAYVVRVTGDKKKIVVRMGTIEATVSIWDVRHC